MLLLVRGGIAAAAAVSRCMQEGSLFMGKVNGRRCVRVFLGGNGGKEEDGVILGLEEERGRKEEMSIEEEEEGFSYVKYRRPLFSRKKSNGTLAKHPKKVVLPTNKYTK